MKIGHLDKNNGAATPVATERKGSTGTAPNAAGAPAAAGQAAPESSTQVELSSGAQAAAAAPGNGDFDAEKVQRIAQAIREGRFIVNPEAIADKLIANAQELLSGVNGTH